MIYDLNPGHIHVIDKAADLEKYNARTYLNTHELTPEQYKKFQFDAQHRENMTTATTAYIMDSCRSSFKINNTVKLYDTAGYEHYYRASTVQNRVYLQIPNIYTEHILHVVKVYADQLDPDADKMHKHFTTVTLKLFTTADKFLDDWKQDRRKKNVIKSEFTPNDPDLIAGFIWQPWKM